jgi:hypothetical protein
MDIVTVKAQGAIPSAQKGVLDRHLAEGLEDLKSGRTHGPYASAEEAIAALEGRVSTNLR